MSDLAELRNLLDAATPRPWATRHGFTTLIDPPRDGLRRAALADCAMSHGLGSAGDTDRANAALIVAAVNELPRLLDRIEALEKALVPFAKVGAEWDRSDEPHPDILISHPAREHSVVTPEDFRRAAAALGIAQ